MKKSEKGKSCVLDGCNANKRKKCRCQALNDGCVLRSVNNSVSGLDTFVICVYVFQTWRTDKVVMFLLFLTACQMAVFLPFIVACCLKFLGH